MQPFKGIREEAKQGGLESTKSQREERHIETPSIYHCFLPLGAFSRSEREAQTLSRKWQPKIYGILIVPEDKN